MVCAIHARRNERGEGKKVEDEKKKKQEERKKAKEEIVAVIDAERNGTVITENRVMSI